MKIVNFSIDAIKKTVSISGSAADGAFVGVQHLVIHGHEDKTVHELEAHARAEARRLLIELAQTL